MPGGERDATPWPHSVHPILIHVAGWQALFRELEEELGVTIDATTAAPDEVLDFEEESVRSLSGSCGAVENRCPQEHDDVRWVTIDDATHLHLADRAYVSLIEHS